MAVEAPPPFIVPFIVAEVVKIEFADTVVAVGSAAVILKDTDTGVAS